MGTTGIPVTPSSQYLISVIIFEHMRQHQQNEKAHSKTKHLILYEELLEFFLSAYQPGDLLPTENQLLSRFDAGRGTLRTALNRLAEKSIIQRIPGKGTFLSERYQVGLKRYRTALILSEQEFADTTVWQYTWYNNMEMINGALKEALKLNIAVELVPESAVLPEIETDYDGYLALRYIRKEVLEQLTGPVEQIHYELDIHHGLKLVAEDSIALGARQPAYIGNVKDGRIETVQAVLASHDLPPIPHHRIVPCQGTSAGGYEAAVLLLERSGLPDCIYCSTDLRALGVLAYLKEHRIDVPDRVMLYGFDGTRVSQASVPSLTTCAFDWQYFGKHAVRRLRSLLDSGEAPVPVRQKGQLVRGGTTPSQRRILDRSSFIERTCSMEASASVETMEFHLQEGAAVFGLDASLEALYQWSLKHGYITRELLEGNEHYAFYDYDYDISYHLQISHARKSYLPGQTRPQVPHGAQCLICREAAGTPGRELLRVLPVELSKPYFLQLTPFPVFPRHFVLIDCEHVPMCIDDRAVRDIFLFLELAPEYVVCSNSDKPWAGSSILEHMHFQTARDIDLPIFSARASAGSTMHHRGVTLQRLHYPIASVRLSGSDRNAVAEEGSKLTAAWKDLWRDNTVNLAARIRHGVYELYIIFRNPGWRNPRHLMQYKSEGVGIVEVSGHWLFPPPEDEMLREEVRQGGKRIIREFFAALNPVSSETGDEISLIMSSLFLKKD